MPLPIVTEREVERGILKAKNTEDHCLAYIRDISNINITLLRMACKFVDVAAKSVDNEAQKLLKVSHRSKVKSAFNYTGYKNSLLPVFFSGEMGYNCHDFFYYVFAERFCWPKKKGRRNNSSRLEELKVFLFLNSRGLYSMHAFYVCNHFIIIPVRNF